MPVLWLGEGRTVVMKKRIEFIGGLHDGKEIVLVDPPPCIWVEGEGAGRCYDRAKPGRIPYYAVLSARPASEQQAHRRDSYMCGGTSHALCGGCGAFHALEDKGERIKNCMLCGHSLEREPA